MRSRVDLPDPVGPTMTCSDAGAKWASKPASAATDPDAVVNERPTPSHVIVAASTGPSATEPESEPESESESERPGGTGSDLKAKHLRAAGPVGRSLRQP